MSKITQSARGERCQIRFPGIYNHDLETTVFAHYRLAGYCGTGIKPAYACSRCHDLADGRLKADCAEGEIQTAFAEGVMRTLVLLHEKGLIKL
ncbi:TPA: nuclease domain-containing protein [Neisseria meningitidis]